MRIRGQRGWVSFPVPLKTAGLHLVEEGVVHGWN